MIGLGTEIRDTAEFNRRAAIALRGAGDPTPFMVAVIRHIDAGVPLTDAEQRGLYNTVRARRREISDQMVITYAELRARGYE